jgi:hypothetical protein
MEPEAQKKVFNGLALISFFCDSKVNPSEVVAVA